MGTVQVEKNNHRLVFTFNDEVKDKQHIHGSFVASANQTVEGVTKTVTYVLPGGTSQEIKFEVRKYPQSRLEGELLYKYGTHDKQKPRIAWDMRINRSKTDMENHAVKITDNISLGAFSTYIENDFNLYEVEYETTNTNYAALKKTIKTYPVTTDPAVYQADSANKALLRFVDGKRGFELLMPSNMGTKSFYLRYYTTSPADTSEVKNSGKYLIDNEPQLVRKNWGSEINTKKEINATVKTVKSVGATITADIAGKIKITKYDEADATVKLQGVVFDILKKDTKELVETVTTDQDGIAVSKVLDDGKYIVKEKTPKPGYVVNSQ
ncbi:prealbumin-like fold domain-containing protein, partial [Streptococcus oralis]|uniref:prealbumin-like fold domain-containing protein n=1 Tax=Streptococcus oralis TaxID=1303 RepID=UPI000A7ADD3E